MSEDKFGKSHPEQAPSPAESARLLVRCAMKGALGTLDRRSGHPYTSLVTLATDPAGAPVFLVSRLALHTQNLEADARASILVDGTGTTGEPLAAARLTLIGRAGPVATSAARDRFLRRHPQAEAYAGFADFSFYALTVEGAHFVGGFGRIVDLAPNDLLLDVSGAGALVAAETEIVSHMNEDHAGALELYAKALCAAPGGPWRMTGIDPEGCDIVCDGDARRVGFANRIASPGEAREELVRLTREARRSLEKT